MICCFQAVTFEPQTMESQSKALKTSTVA